MKRNTTHNSIFHCPLLRSAVYLGAVIAFVALCGLLTLTRAQTLHLTPMAINPAAEGDMTNVSMTLQAFHQGTGIMGAERGGLLNVSLPTQYGSEKGKDAKYLYIGFTMQDKNLNITNDFRGMLRYAMRFKVNEKMYFTGGLAAGLDYTHINTDRLLTDGGYDPALQDMEPNTVAFRWQAGIQLHNRRFAVGLFTDFPGRGSLIGCNARVRTNPDKKFCLEAYSFMYYYLDKRMTNRQVIEGHLQGVIGRFLVLGAGYNSTGLFTALAALRVKNMNIGYGCGLSHFKTSAGGANTIRHTLTLDLVFKSKAERMSLSEARY